MVELLTQALDFVLKEQMSDPEREAERRQP